MRFLRIVTAVVVLAGGVLVAQTVRPDSPTKCDACDAWNRPREPYRVFGNTYYVGVAGLSSVLLTSEEGHVLLDGALPQSAELIAANVATLGFKLSDVKWILASHAHYDHVGGIAALQRASGAPAVSSASGAVVLRSGRLDEDDPQFGLGTEATSFPSVTNVRVIADGEVIRVGRVAITGHHTPGHTPGGMSWSWLSCEGATCRSIVYADSLNPVAADGFRFSSDPNRVATFRRTIAAIATLPCDLLIAVHPGFGGTEGKPQPCRVYAADAQSRLEKRLAAER